MPVIEAQDVSKRFLLRHNASVELKVRFLSLLHRGKRQSIEEFWALKDVSLRIEARRRDRPGRAQRLGQEHVPEAHRGHSPADERPAAGRRGARISSMIELGVGFHPS